jgi:hypothetical protein
MWKRTFIIRCYNKVYQGCHLFSDAGVLKNKLYDLKKSDRKAYLLFLAIQEKSNIINNRWKLKSRRVLRVLEHSQARAGG